MTQSTNSPYGTIDGVEITEQVIARLVKNAEKGFPGAAFLASGRPARTNEPSKAVTVRLSDSELSAVTARAKRENLTRSDAIRAALAEWSAACSVRLKNRSLRFSATALPVLLFLTACTGAPPSQPSTLGSGSETTPASASIWKQVEYVENETPVYWAGQDLVGITIFGSHDCYDEPTALTRVSSHEATVEWELAPTGPCDSDIGGHTFQAELPDEIDTTEPIIISGLRGSESSVELPVKQ